MFRQGWILGLVFLVSCGVEIESGAQQAGQRCFVPSDCSDGLTCFERVCVPPATIEPLGSNNVSNNVNNQLDLGFEDVPDADVPACELGSRTCVDDNLSEICVAENNIPTVVQIECDRQEFCSEGRCIAVGECTDLDGDGYGAGCDRGPDCNDRDQNINPGMPENCQNDIDDNCNGVINEGCNPDGCCADGCSEREFCNIECACEEYQPQICRSQNQPCSNIDDFANGYFCVALDDSDEGRCYGVCSTIAMDPDSTCPDPGTVCAFGDDNDTSALCVSTCTFDQGCGEDSLGCLPWDIGTQDGVCLPSNPNRPIGSACDPDQFLDCATGAICVPRLNGNGGVCREACRPYAHPNGSSTTDCSSGHCYAYSSDIGVCMGDNRSTDGEQCQPQFTMCNEDAVACFPSQTGSRCQKVCRLAGSDCDPGWACNQFDPQQEDLGVCVLLD